MFHFLIMKAFSLNSPNSVLPTKIEFQMVLCSLLNLSLGKMSCYYSVTAFF